MLVTQLGIESAPKRDFFTEFDIEKEKVHHSIEQEGHYRFGLSNLGRRAFGFRLNMVSTYSFEEMYPS